MSNDAWRRYDRMYLADGAILGLSASNASSSSASPTVGKPRRCEAGSGS